ncbi:unnamed protein product, partial [Mesorhabditis belari]|uniref:Uncharacterized protein n=1 Tax=Mesorhabditis belari TaxID=2138241 RepID=A0AAF3ES60_9BILA
MNFRATRCVWDHGMSEDETVIFKTFNVTSARHSPLTESPLLTTHSIENSQKIWRLERLRITLFYQCVSFESFPAPILAFPFDRSGESESGRLVGDFPTADGPDP